MTENHSLAASEAVFRAIIEGGGVFTLKPQGKSMLPTVQPGVDSVSIVKLEGRAQRFDILFYKRADGSFVLHRVVALGENDYTLCGDGQVDFEYGVTDDAVIGVVSVIHRTRGDLLRGTKEFAAAGKRRLRSRFARRVYRKILHIKRRLFKK